MGRNAKPFAFSLHTLGIFFDPTNNQIFLKLDNPNEPEAFKERGALNKTVHPAAKSVPME